MDLTITATVTVLETASDMLDVLETLVAAGKGWYGAVTAVPSVSGPTWNLNVFREGQTDVLSTLGCVIVTDGTFVSRYSSVDEYNSAHPDHPISGS